MASIRRCLQTNLGAADNPLPGTGASRGIAIGPANLMGMRLLIAERWILRSDREAEAARLDMALAGARAEISITTSGGSGQ